MIAKSNNTGHSLMVVFSLANYVSISQLQVVCYVIR